MWAEKSQAGHKSGHIPMRLPNYLTRSAAGRFIFRQRVPADLRATIGREFIKRSLGRDLLPARVAALDLAAGYALVFAEIRGRGMSKKLTVEDVLASVAKNGARPYVITTAAGVRIEATTAEDHARAMEALETIGRIEVPTIAAPATS